PSPCPGKVPPPTGPFRTAPPPVSAVGDGRWAPGPSPGRSVVPRRIRPSARGRLDGDPAGAEAGEGLDEQIGRGSGRGRGRRVRGCALPPPSPSPGEAPPAAGPLPPRPPAGLGGR